MSRTVSMIAFTIGMLLAWGFPVTPVAAEPEFVWGTAEMIEAGAGDAHVPRVAVDPQGNATAVWQQTDGTRFNIWANRFVPDVGWGTAELIETGAGDVFNPQVAVDPQGNATAVWNQDDGTRLNMWANRFVPGVGWGTATLIETDDAGLALLPQVSVDPQGNATAVWQQDDGTRHNIWANRFVPDVGWGTAELIETDGAGANGAQVAVDPQGNAVAVWNQHGGSRSNIWANRFVPGVGWGTAELIETEDTGDAFNPQVAVDSQGNAVAVWHQSDGTDSNILANRFVPGVGWGVATLIETDEDEGVFPFPRPQVAMDAAGSAVAVWATDDRTRFNIWANRFGEDIVSPDLVITSPVDGETLISPLVTVTGTASDDLGVDKVELSTDGMTWDLAMGTTSWSGSVTVAEGPNTIFARATDTSGKTATVSVAVTVDTAKPTAVAGEDQTVTVGARHPSTRVLPPTTWRLSAMHGTLGTGRREPARRGPTSIQIREPTRSTSRSEMQPATRIRMC